MTRTIITPTQANINLLIPREYIGRKIEVTFFALDESDESEDLTRTEPQFENISPSGDPFWADPRNVQALKDYDKMRAEGKIETYVLTPEKRKEWFGE